MNKLGPDAEKFVDEVMNRRNPPIYLVGTSTLAVTAGVILYWRDFGGINTSPFGLALGLGGLAALIAWLGGNLLIPKRIGQLATVGAEMRAAEGAPSRELASRMHATQQRLRLIGLVDVVLLVFAVAAMASARYL